ncbi:MAG: hypothetical protein MUP40_02100 [Actinobacteria bacterium]|nr:hypothetical protein [Actinomycetota bacterium]
MAIKRMAVTLDEDEIARLRQIITDEDKDGAFRFVRDVLEERVKANELPHCVPFFDAGYNPGQADSFKRGE